MTWALAAKLFAWLCFAIVVMLLIARALANNALRTAIEREKADRVFDAAKKDEEVRAAKATKAIADDKAREDARIDAMTPEEAEREVNK